MFGSVSEKELRGGLLNILHMYGTTCAVAEAMPRVFFIIIFFFIDKATSNSDVGHTKQI